MVAFATDETKPLFKYVCQPAPKSLFCSPAVYQDLSTRHDWPVKKAIVRLANLVKGKSEADFP